MTTARRIIAVAGALLAAWPAAAQGIRIRDYRHLVTLSNLQVSPDGRQILLVKSIQDFKADKNVTSLVLADVATGKLTSLTEGAAPHWSPSGRQIAYTAADSKGKDQVFLIAVSGGSPHQLTHTDNGVQHLA